MTTQPATAKPPDSRIDFLDHMRIFAFVSVLVGHKFFGDLWSVVANPNNHVTVRYIAEALVPFCFGGAAGVVVFFFISGYIITHVLRKEATLEFVIKRIFRIYPLYVFVVVLEAFLRVVDGDGVSPILSILLPRLLLLGDFFSTGYALGGVDWTLRIEMLFYLLMAVLKSTGILRKPHQLPTVFLVLSAILYFSKPFPSFAGWSDGYLNLYGPFLFVGSLIYLAEHKLADRALCVTSILLIYFLVLIMTAKIQPIWKESHYAALSLILFLTTWFFRARLTAGPVVRTLSSLTYSVYLFHNWLWLHLEPRISALGISALPIKLQTLFVLLLICYLAHRLVEQPGIRIGRSVLARINVFRLRLQNAGVP